jgi:4,5-DOPA dioxygenase extradiol
MNALLQNPYTEAWDKLGVKLPRPKAIVCVSAHWYTQDAAVAVSARPKTIHDFGGFPESFTQVGRKASAFLGRGWKAPLSFPSELLVVLR